MTPIVSNEDIRAYAESIAGECDPRHFRKPGRLSFSRLIEGYLGAALEYQDLYYAEDEPPIAGATVFEDVQVLVFSKEELCIKPISVSARTIILDDSSTATGSVAFCLFTVLHEAGHLCMHQAAYAGRFARRAGTGGTVCCRKSDIAGSRGSGRPVKLNPARTREHQSNVFAAYAAMPRRTFVPSAREIIRSFGCDDGVYVYDDVVLCPKGDSRLRKLVSTLAETYGISYPAVRIHLNDLSLLTPFSETIDSAYFDQGD